MLIETRGTGRVGPFLDPGVGDGAVATGPRNRTVVGNTASQSGQIQHLPRQPGLLVTVTPPPRPQVPLRSISFLELP